MGQNGGCDIRVFYFLNLRTSGDAIHPLLGRRLRSALKQPQFENQISLKSHPFLKDHRFFGTAVFPAAAYVEMTLAAAAQVFKSATCIVENVKFREALLISEGECYNDATHRHTRRRWKGFFRNL